MASRIDDRWLWLGFGIFAIGAVWGIRAAMTDIVSLLLIDPAQYDQKAEQSETIQGQQRKLDPEDTISIDTLRTLVESPNLNISHAARSLVISRLQPHIMNGKANIITQDLSSQDEDTRRRAETAIRFLRDSDPAFMHLSLPSDRSRSQRYAFRTPVNLAGRDAPSRITTWDDESLGLPLRSRPVVVPSERSPIAGWTDVPRERPPRPRDDEDEDEATRAQLRRWRREAMVVQSVADEADMTASDFL